MPKEAAITTIVTVFKPLIVFAIAGGFVLYDQIIGSLAITISLGYAVRKWYLMERDNKNGKRKDK